MKCQACGKKFTARRHTVLYRLQSPSEFSYYHFVRPHESLAVELSRPIPRRGQQQSKKYRRRTPAIMAGLTDKRWTVRELISYPLLR